MNAITEAMLVPADANEPHWIGTSRVTVMVRGEQTGGAYGMIRSEVRRGSSPPLHVHETADEAIYVLAGRVRVRCAEEEMTLTSGGYVNLPRGIAHTFLAEEDSVMLGILTPAGTEDYFVEGGPVANADTPPAPDIDRLTAAAAKFRCPLVGPPLSLES